jgi:hypothetical protein
VTPPVRRPSCRYCCTACGHHFSSLVAFDRHRSDGVRCEDPRQVPGLAVQTRDAVCRILPNNLEAVELWEAVPWRDLAIARLRAARMGV